jgi:hypothetical protein
MTRKTKSDNKQRISVISNDDLFCALCVGTRAFQTVRRAAVKVRAKVEEVAEAVKIRKKKR